MCISETTRHTKIIELTLTVDGVPNHLKVHLLFFRLEQIVNGDIFLITEVAAILLVIYVFIVVHLGWGRVRHLWGSDIVSVFESDAKSWESWNRHILGFRQSINVVADFVGWVLVQGSVECGVGIRWAEVSISRCSSMASLDWHRDSRLCSTRFDKIGLEIVGMNSLSP